MWVVKQLARTYDMVIHLVIVIALEGLVVAGNIGQSVSIVRHLKAVTGKTRHLWYNVKIIVVRTCDSPTDLALYPSSIGCRSYSRKKWSNAFYKLLSLCTICVVECSLNHIIRKGVTQKLL